MIRDGQMSITGTRIDSAPRAAAPAAERTQRDEKLEDGVLGGVAGGALTAIVGVASAGKHGPRASGMGLAVVGLLPGAAGGAFGEAGVAGSTIAGAVLMGGGLAAEKGLSFGKRMGAAAIGAAFGAVALGVPAALGAYAASRYNDGKFS
ncbi:MAG: hypothetical protein JWM25_2028 [Thermoleophilia bacterium]|nr:hypothetical protein [Thermoleophilia bacterium]MCZ4497443.1 hypothetical protein [Thermoleophilia bacterium]